MALTRIQYGGDVASGVLNDNFEYLDDRITEVGSSITTIQSNLASVSSTLNGRINNLDYVTPQDLASEVDDLEESISDIETTVNNISFMPDYANAISISLPYTASADGWISASLLSNGNTVTLTIGSVVVGKAQNTAGDTRYTDQSSNTFPIANGQKVTATNSNNSCSYWFIPMKEV